MTSKAVFEIVNQLVYFEITVKDWIFIAFERRRGNVEVCLFLSYFWRTFRTGARWLFEICFPNLVFLLVHNRRLKGKSDLLEELQTQENTKKQHQVRF